MSLIGSSISATTRLSTKTRIAPVVGSISTVDLFFGVGHLLVDGFQGVLDRGEDRFARDAALGGDLRDRGVEFTFHPALLLDEPGGSLLTSPTGPIVVSWAGNRDPRTQKTRVVDPRSAQSLVPRGRIPSGRGFRQGRPLEVVQDPHLATSDHGSTPAPTPPRPSRSHRGPAGLERFDGAISVLGVRVFSSIAAETQTNRWRTRLPAMDMPDPVPETIDGHTLRAHR